MKSFAVVIIDNMQSRRYDWYVKPIHPNDVKDLMELMELICVSPNNSGGRPSDEFF
jgi:hypothetical protein